MAEISIRNATTKRRANFTERTIMQYNATRLWKTRERERERVKNTPYITLQGQLGISAAILLQNIANNLLSVCLALDRNLVFLLSSHACTKNNFVARHKCWKVIPHAVLIV